MKVIFKDWKVGNSGTQFFLYPLFAESFGTCKHPHRQWRNVCLVTLFSEITNQIVYLKWVLAICKTCQFTFLQENKNCQFFSFSSTATQYLVHNILRVPHDIQKDVCFWRMLKTCTNIFFVLNLTIIYIKLFSFTCNNTIFSVSFFKWNNSSPIFLSTPLSSVRTTAFKTW